jgi:hypothetical protein
MRMYMYLLSCETNLGFSEHGTVTSGEIHFVTVNCYQSLCKWITEDEPVGTFCPLLWRKCILYVN